MHDEIVLGLLDADTRGHRIDYLMLIVNAPSKKSQRGQAELGETAFSGRI